MMHFVQCALSQGMASTANLEAFQHLIYPKLRQGSLVSMNGLQT